MTSRHILKMLNENIVHCCATNCADYWESLRCRLLCHDHTKMGCHLGQKADDTGPPSLITPRSAINRAASVTVFASMPRTAKYPLSDGWSDPDRLPKANTCTHESAASGSERSSPSLRAIS